MEIISSSAGAIDKQRFGFGEARASGCASRTGPASDAVPRHRRWPHVSSPGLARIAAFVEAPSKPPSLEIWDYGAELMFVHGKSSYGDIGSEQGLWYCRDRGGHGTGTAAKSCTWHLALSRVRVENRLTDTNILEYVPKISS